MLVERTTPAPLRGVIPARPTTSAEKEFVEAYAKEIEKATANVAAYPERTFARGSLEARLRGALLKMDMPTRVAMQKRAQAHLTRQSAPQRRVTRRPVQRRPMSRGPVRRGPTAQRVGLVQARPTRGLTADLKAKLRRAVEARLEAQLRSPKDRTKLQAHLTPLQIPKTWVEVGYFSKEIVTAGRKDITLNAPDVLEFRWWTEEEDAEYGKWELHGPKGQMLELGSGGAGDAPKRVFRVDLKKYLPATPPTTPLVYYLRVEPRIKGKITKVPGATPNSSKVIKEGSKSAGPISAPVVITYVASSAPPQEFDFPKVYRKLHFRLDKLHMVDDQTGPGGEEFHVAGFIQEGSPAGAGAQHRFRYYRELHPDGPRWADLGGRWTFHLNNPDQPQWPRFYCCVVSILEEDAGAALDEWLSSVWKAANAVLKSEIYDIVADYLEDFLEQYGEEVLDEALQYGAQIAQWIASIASATSVTIVGMVVTVAAWIIAAIVADAADDYYGTEAFTLVLPTNDTQYVQSLPGQALPGGGYRLKGEKLVLKGAVGHMQAAAWDGVVDVRFHFEFTDPDDRP